MQGVAGIQGFQGRQGVQGPQGRQGSAPTGATGATGRAGVQGPLGVAGVQGSQGVQGPQGRQGAQGVQGAAGSQGRQGVQGAASPPASTTSTPNVSALGVNTAVPPTGTLRATGSITAGYSDIRLKTNVSVIPNCVEKVRRMTGIFYKQNKLAEKYGFTNNDRQIGVIAQQIQPFAPEIIDIAPFDMDEKGLSLSGENYMTVRYERIIPILLEAIKEQQLQINILKDIVDK